MPFIPKRWMLAVLSTDSFAWLTQKLIRKCIKKNTVSVVLFGFVGYLIQKYQFIAFKYCCFGQLRRHNLQREKTTPITFAKSIKHKQTLDVFQNYKEYTYLEDLEAHLHSC